jgi:hypothetical protein
VNQDANGMTQVELRTFTNYITVAINANHARYATTLEGVERKIFGIVDQLEALEIHVPPSIHELDGKFTRRACKT